MPRKAFETMSEPLFYVLMALQHRELCGVEIAAWVEERTAGRIQLGPGTLYTILPKLMEEGALEETAVNGRRRNYQITEKGRELYRGECDRLRRCLQDAEAAETPMREVCSYEQARISPVPLLALGD